MRRSRLQLAPDVSCQLQHLAARFLAVCKVGTVLCIVLSVPPVGRNITQELRAMFEKISRLQSSISGRAGTSVCCCVCNWTR